MPDPAETLLICPDAQALIRDIPDFPHPGILFKDITPILADAAALHAVVAAMSEMAARCKPEIVTGIESRGFVFGVPVAMELGLGFAPVRKSGKLPHLTVSESYDLEYGASVLEIHRDALHPGQRVLIVDDLLATGGTAQATARLVEALGAKVAGFQFLIELKALEGRRKLSGYDIGVLWNL